MNPSGSFEPFGSLGPLTLEHVGSFEPSLIESPGIIRRQPHRRKGKADWRQRQTDVRQWQADRRRRHVVRQTTTRLSRCGRGRTREHDGNDEDAHG